MRRTRWTDFVDSERLFKQFIDGADVGIAVFDERLRYRALNSRLAAINCCPVASHIGKTPYEMFGDLGRQVEPAMLQAFTSGTPTLNLELAGVLPGQSREGRWINNVFAIRDTSGRVQQVAAVVVELPKNIWLQPTQRPQESSAAPILKSWGDFVRFRCEDNLVCRSPEVG